MRTVLQTVVKNRKFRQFRENFDAGFEIFRICILRRFQGLWPSNPSSYSQPAHTFGRPWARESGGLVGRSVQRLRCKYVVYSVCGMLRYIWRPQNGRFQLGGEVYRLMYLLLIPRLHDTTGNRIDNRLYRVNIHPTGCQIGCQTGLTTVLNEQLFIQPVVKPGCTTGLTNTV